MADGDWQITIEGDGGDTLTLDSRTKWNLTKDVQTRDDNTVDSVDWLIEVEGDLVSATCSSLIDDFLAVLDKSQTFNPKEVKITRDSVDEWSFSPGGTTLQGPWITRTATMEEEGNFNRRVHFALLIFVKQAGNAPTNGYSLNTRLYEEKEGDETVLKQWEVSVKARNLATAKEIALGYKPSGDNLNEKKDLRYKDAFAAYIWTWSKQQSGSGGGGDKSRILEYDCKVTYSGHGLGYVTTPQVDDSGGQIKPMAHERRKQATRINVDGRVRAYNKDVTAPPPHYAETYALLRDWPSETNSFATPDPQIPGLYNLTYQERWIWLGDEPPPVPDHHDHAELKPLRPPSDGGIG